MRSIRQLIQISIDSTILAGSFLLAYLLRYDFNLPFQILKIASFQLPYIVILEYSLILALGAHRVVWQFVSAADVLTLLRPLIIAAALLLCLRLAAPHLGFAHGIYLLVPGGVVVINLTIAAVGIMGARIVRRLVAERHDRLRVVPPQKKRRMIIVGAGSFGLQVAKELTQRPELGVTLVGFVDDDPSKLGTSVAGYRVLAKLQDLRRLVVQNEIDDVVIAITEAPKDTIRSVVEICEQSRVTVKIIPGLYEIIGGQVSISRLRTVSIEDLLGREPVMLDNKKVCDFIQGKTIAVTGAGGSIGSELCRQIAEFQPASLLLVERAEHALFQIHQELTRKFPRIETKPYLADVTSEDRMRRVLTESERCDALFHAAAHKHVPMMEWNPSEAIRNNVLGTKCVADLVGELNIPHFVMISTDKAINPTSIMGASKRAAELYVQAMGKAHSTTKYVSVRFGNVLGSAGSVVPIFKQQIAEGGPITVTHPDMVRYFMTIPEAAQLVMQAGTLGEGGEVFILDMGEPVKIVDLARDLIRLSGLKPDEDIEIHFSGMRPGEKLFEELSADEEGAEKTNHDKIFIGQVKECTLGDINPAFSRLKDSLRAISQKEIYDALKELVPEFVGSAQTEVSDNS